MSRCEDINNTIWDDPDFEVLSPYATLLYLWSWTNPRCDMAGIYKVSHVKMTESKVPLEHVPEALAELERTGFAFYKDSVLWVRTRVKHLRSRSPAMAKAVARDLSRVPVGHRLRTRFLEEYASDPWLRDVLRDASREGLRNLPENTESKPDSHTLPPPSREGLGQRARERAKGSTEKVSLPDDFPRELQPHIQVAFRVLRDLAQRHNARAIEPLSLVAVFMAHSHKPLVAAAYEYVAWADGQASRRRDVLAGYRNWLAKTNELASVELLDENGRPGGGSASGSSNPSTLLREMGFVDGEIVESAA